MKKSKYILFGVGFILFVCIIVATVRINMKYPQVEYKDIAFNTSEQWQECCTLTVNNAKVYTNEEAVKIYGQDVLEVSDGTDFDIIEVEASVSNITDSTIPVYLYDLYLETLVYANGVAAEAQLLTDTPQLDIELMPYEKKEVTLCYVVYEGQLSKKDWDNISTKDFWLTGEHYPVKKRWMLQ